MNWIILIVAGLCEVGFTYSLGRAKGVTGTEWWTWISAFDNPHRVDYRIKSIIVMEQFREMMEQRELSQASLRSAESRQKKTEGQLTRMHQK